MEGQKDLGQVSEARPSWEAMALVPLQFLCGGPNTQPMSLGADGLRSGHDVRDVPPGTCGVDQESKHLLTLGQPYPLCSSIVMVTPQLGWRLPQGVGPSHCTRLLQGTRLASPQGHRAGQKTIPVTGCSCGLCTCPRPSRVSQKECGRADTVTSYLIYFCLL